MIYPHQQDLLERLDADAPDIVYYVSKPEASDYPIAILCTGSSSKDDIRSVIHFHRYFLQECMDLHVGVLTVELWGVDGSTIHMQEYRNNYTRSQRLKDHIAVIELLKSNPPLGWNGKLIFLGVSEGGPLVTTLTARYNDIALATVNWCGAGDWSWREELWAFMIDMRSKFPCWVKILDHLPPWMPLSLNFPQNKRDYDKCMEQTLLNPCVELEFMGMTHKYHADALQYPLPDYEKIKTPFLVVAGGQDSIIPSCDAFVLKAETVGVPLTYVRIDDMDHCIRLRPEIIQDSFRWLREQVNRQC